MIDPDSRAPLRTLPSARLRRHVACAIAEYDRLGRDVFLTTYGYGPANSYLLVHNGRRYDSKAIAGVAH